MSAPAGSGAAAVNIPLKDIHNTSADRSESITPLNQKNMSGTPEPRRRGHGPHRKKVDFQANPDGTDGERVSVNKMGRIYRRVLEFSIITRYLIYVSPIALCIAVPIIVGATSAQHAFIGEVRIVWFFTWIEVVWLSLWGSKIVSHFLPYLFQILAGVVSSGTRKHALIIKALETPLTLAGWAITCLATFMPLMLRNPDSRARHLGQLEWMTIVQEVLGAALVASLLFLGERFLIQLLSVSYHRRQFNTRIADSKREIYILGLLYEGSRRLFPMYCPEFAEEDFSIADQLNLRAMIGGSRNELHKRSGSQTPMRLIQDVGRIGDKVTSVFGNMAQEITGKQVFNPNSAHSIVTSALEKKRTSEALARRIWLSFVMEGEESLSYDDIVDVLGSERTLEAEEAFARLDRDGNGDVSLEEMVLTVVEMSRERKAINSSLHDVDQAINVLDGLLLIVLFVAIVFVFIAFLNKSFVTTLATAGTALLSLSFVFSVTAQEVLGSCIFVFVKHPFDIGDRVTINTSELTVEHISLLFSVFKRNTGADVGRLVQIPNIVLNTLWIENISRSKAMKEQLSLYISFDTSFEDVQLLKQELLTFVRDKENSRDYQPDLEVQVLGTSDLSKLELRVEIQHKANWANEVIRAQRRSKFMCALVAALRRVPIYGPGGGGDDLGSAANASYSVAIPVDVAKANMEASAKAKNEARLIPIQPAAVESDIKRRKSNGLTPNESNAIDDLTSPDPALDYLRDEIRAEDDEKAHGVGELPTIDRRAEADIKGIIRRQSTRGRRKADSGSDLSRVGTAVSQSSQAYTSINDYVAPPIPQDAFGYHPAHRPSQSSAVRSVPSSNLGRGPSTAYRTVSRQSDDGYGEV